LEITVVPLNFLSLFSYPPPINLAKNLGLRAKQTNNMFNFIFRLIIEYMECFLKVVFILNFSKLTL